MCAQPNLDLKHFHHDGFEFRADEEWYVVNALYPLEFYEDSEDYRGATRLIRGIQELDWNCYLMKKKFYNKLQSLNFPHKISYVYEVMDVDTNTVTRKFVHPCMVSIRHSR